MQRERQNNQNKSGRERKDGYYIIVTHHFLKEWVRILGVGPVVLYEELLTYCHKEKYIAWPTIDSLCEQMGIAKTTLLRYQDTLIKFGLIKNITRGKSTTGHYRNNIYQITPLEELTEHPEPGKIIDFLGSKMKPDRYQNDTSIGSNMKLSLVSNRYPNNNNLNKNNTTTNRESVVVDFKKLKEKGEERMRVIRERMVDLNFKEEFIEKILKEYSIKKIEEKLDLLMERKNIQSPAGWLMAALKNDYQDPPSSLLFPRKRESIKSDEEPAEVSDNLKSRGTMHCALNESEQIDPSSTENTDIPEQVSHEKALKAIKLIQDNLATCISPHSSRKRTRFRKNVGGG